MISLQEEQQGIVDMGASMRLGSCASTIYPGTKSYDFYGQTDTIHERHRHRWEFNPTYREQLEKCGLTIASVSQNEGLVEIIEIADHPFFIGASSRITPTILTPRRSRMDNPLFCGMTVS